MSKLTISPEKLPQVKVALPDDKDTDITIYRDFKAIHIVQKSLKATVETTEHGFSLKVANDEKIAYVEVTPDGVIINAGVIPLN